MGSVNKVILLGNLGANPELKYLPSGMPVCEMRIATSEFFKDKNDQKQERTEWHSVIVWGQMGENCAKYLTKGRQVYVEGSLQTRSWDDKDGKKQYKTEVKALNVVFLRGGDGPGAGAGEPRSSASGGEGGGQSYGGGGGQSYAGGGGGRSYGGGGRSRPAPAPAGGDTPPAEDFGSGTDDDIPF